MLNYFKLQGAYLSTFGIVLLVFVFVLSFSQVGVFLSETFGTKIVDEVSQDVTLVYTKDGKTYQQVVKVESVIYEDGEFGDVRSFKKTEGQ